jgi:uncharacterized membrane protein
VVDGEVTPGGDPEPSARPAPTPASGRVGRVIPHVPIAALTIGYAWYFAHLSVVVEDGYGTFGFDMGIFDQGVWLLSRFHAPFVTVMGRDLFGDHTSFVLLLAVPLYWLHPAPQTLLVAQSVLLAGAAIPIYLVGRRLLDSDLLASALAAAYLCNPALQDGNLDQFHPEAFAVLALGAALYAAISGRRRLLWTAVVVALLVKEDTGFLVVALGVWVTIRRDRRIGGTIVAVAVVYLVVAYEVVIRTLLGTTAFYADRIPFGGARGLLTTAFGHPGRLVAYLRSAGRPFYLWQLGCSTGWAWLISPEVAAIGLLTWAENTLSTFGYMHQIAYHYTLVLVPVLVVGSIWAISRLATPARRRTATAGVLAAAVASSVLWGLGPLSTNPYPYVVGNDTAGRINEIAETIPSGAVISADDRYVPHVDRRLRCYQWPTPFSTENWGLNTQTGRRLTFAGQVTYLFLPTHLAPGDRHVLASIRSEYRIVHTNAVATLWERRSTVGTVGVEQSLPHRVHDRLHA